MTAKKVGLAYTPKQRPWIAPKPGIPLGNLALTTELLKDITRRCLKYLQHCSFWWEH
jgi:hypothetical protein